MDDIDDDAFAMLKLVLAGGAATTRRSLLDNHGGSAIAAVAAGSRPAGGLDEAQRARLDTLPTETLRASLDWLRQPRHHLIGWSSPDYPPLLRRIPSPPLALFVDGDPALLWHAAVAVVGSRSPSTGGRDNARTFARALALAGLAVVSGLASGIDTAAHLGALEVEQGLTVAILGTGPDLAYPPGNSRLRERIAECGAVVSEHPPGTPARPGHFPSRNRILAGLALGTLVIEAAERSGTLITARQAADSGREVFAVPGSIHNPLARGCHRLIRDGATLAEGIDDILPAIATMAATLAEALRGRLVPGPGRPHSGNRAGAIQAPAPLDPDYQGLWDALGHDPTGMDELIDRTGLTTAELSSMLLLMELDGRVAVEHGRYSRKS